MIFNNIKIYRYLSKAILLNFLFITLILLLILFGNQFFIVINQSFKEGFFSNELIPLMVYKLIRDLPFILSLSFSLSMVLSINKLYKTSELIIFFNAGINDFKIFKLLLPLVLLISFLVFLLTNIIVPNAKNEINNIKENAKSRPEYIFLKEQSFQEFDNRDKTFYSSKAQNKSESEDQILSNIFIFMRNDPKLILANSGEKIYDKDTGNINLNLFDGNIYENLSQKVEKNIAITSFNKLSLRLHEEKPKKDNITSTIDEIDSMSLIKDYTHSNLKEILRRFSAPLSLIIISILAIIIAKVNPRDKKNFAFGYVLTAYICYYNMIIFFTGINAPLLEYSLWTLLPHVFFVILIFAINLLKKNSS